MRILVHDYGGHAFPVELSRALARGGHTVLHAYCGSVTNTGHGPIERRPDDPDNLTIRSVTLDRPVDKYSFLRRWKQERAYSSRIVREAQSFRPEVTLSGCAPLHTQRELIRMSRRSSSRFVYWAQDLFGMATRLVLRRRLPVLGSIVGHHAARLEQELLRQSDRVVAITPDFVPLFRTWSVADEKVHVIENWAPIDELPVLPRENHWARAHGLAGRMCLLYAGNLGLKHDPRLLLELAVRLRDRDDARVVVVSEGLGANWLRARKERLGLESLIVLGFQPFEDFAYVLASADVLLGLLETDAALFSVPSKVLSYLCAARPLVLALPSDNLAARTVVEAAAGIVVPPDDPDAFARSVRSLMDDGGRREELGRNARRHAEASFVIEEKARQFERVLAGP